LGIAEKCKASSVEAESLFRRRPVNTGLQPGAVRRETDLAASAAFVRREKPLKRLASFLTAATGLKPGVNENRPADRDLYEFNGSTF
jgi:hypothetical protein